MANIPVLSGPHAWTDWSRPAHFRESVTLPIQPAGTILTNALAVFLGNLVAGAAWDVVAFLIHQFPWSESRDGLRALHRLIWRSGLDPLKAAVELLCIAFVWRTKYRTQATQLPGRLPLKPVPIPVHNFWFRALWFAALPFVLWTGFVLASIFSGYIVVSNSAVLVATGPQGTCGVWIYNSGKEMNAGSLSLQGYTSKVLNDTQRARDYARSCYSPAFAGVNTASCGFYVVSRLPYYEIPDDFQNGICPFGTTDFDNSPCNSTNNTGSHQMWTGMIDSHYHLGINAPPANRVQFQKNVSCSVINAQKYVATSHGYNTQPGNQNYSFYQMGNITQQGRFQLGVSSPLDNVALPYTFLYNPTMQQFPIGYQTNAVVHYADVTGVWDALPDFRRLDGDTTLVFFSANAVKYVNQVYDPFFLATSPANAPQGSGLDTVYPAVNPVNVMGCVDQYRICNPNTGACTPVGGIEATSQYADQLQFNPAQRVTTQRINVILQNTNTYSNVYGTESAALLASNQVFNYFSPALPDTQWVIEVRGWFETGLAKMQAYAVEYAFNNVPLGKYGMVHFPDANDETLPEWQTQCANQKIANPGQYQVFNLAGVILGFSLGVAILLMSFTLRPLCSGLPWAMSWLKFKVHSQRNSYPQPVHSQEMRSHRWDADSKYQLFGMLMTAVVPDLVGHFPHHIPVYDHDPQSNSWPEPIPSKGTHGLMQYSLPPVSSSIQTPLPPPPNPPALPVSQPAPVANPPAPPISHPPQSSGQASQASDQASQHSNQVAGRSPDQISEVSAISAPTDSNSTHSRTQSQDNQDEQGSQQPQGSIEMPQLAV